MKLSKFDLQLIDDNEKETKEVTFGIKVDKNLKAELLKLKAGPRNRKILEFLKALVKENAS